MQTEQLNFKIVGSITDETEKKLKEFNVTANFLTNVYVKGLSGTYTKQDPMNLEQRTTPVDYDVEIKNIVDPIAKSGDFEEELKSIIDSRLLNFEELEKNHRVAEIIVQLTCNPTSKAIFNTQSRQLTEYSEVLKPLFTESDQATCKNAISTIFTTWNNVRKSGNERDFEVLDCNKIVLGEILARLMIIYSAQKLEAIAAELENLTDTTHQKQDLTLEKRQEIIQKNKIELDEIVKRFRKIFPVEKSE